MREEEEKRGSGVAGAGERTEDEPGEKSEKIHYHHHITRQNPT